MRQPSDTWAYPYSGNPGARWLGNGQIVRQDYRSSSRDEPYDSDQWGCVCARLKTQNSPLVLAGALLWPEVNL
ncbi:hypothetical protein ABHI18_012155 [Aspergillus niger]